MKTKLFLIDFDGTIVYEDILDVICGITERRKESVSIRIKSSNENFSSGLCPLQRRINLLQGVHLNSINNLLGKNMFLRKGVVEFFDYLRRNQYISVLHSGNIIPVLKIYQSHLGIDHVIGTQPNIDNDIIQGIDLSKTSVNFKVNECRKIIKQYNVDKTSIIAIGDSFHDLGVFSMAGLRIAIDPKDGIEKNSDYIIDNDFEAVIKILANC